MSATYPDTLLFIDGRWRAIDAYMRVLCPSPALDGIAGGAELQEHPEIFDAVFNEEDAPVRRDYWSEYGPGGTYEPWQDSQSMVLNLRRGEELDIDYQRREAWCLAPSEPSDFINGEWRYRPPLDAQHLEQEVEQAVNVAAVDGGLRAVDPAQPAVVEYAIHSPYPLVTGSVTARFTGTGTLSPLRRDCDSKYGAKGGRTRFCPRPFVVVSWSFCQSTSPRESVTAALPVTVMPS